MTLPSRAAVMSPLLISSMRRALRPALSQRVFIRRVATTPAEVTYFQPPPPPPPPPQKPSLLRRLFGSTLRAVFFTTLGYWMASPLVDDSALTARNDAETLTKWAPSTDAEQAHEDYINAHPFVQALRANPAYSESRPHMRIPAFYRNLNLTAGTLMGEKRVPFPPLAWLDDSGDAKDFVQISYAGQEMCGHPGIVHGGYLATLLDEGLARSSFAVLPNKLGVTASLKVDYKAPCMADQYIVLRAQVTKAEGRKAWVEGRVETLPAPGEEPVVLATATALYIEPKNAKILTAFNPA